MKGLKEKWHDIIRITEVNTGIGRMYYLTDSSCGFVPLVKEYLMMIQARAAREVSPNTVKNYCYMLWYFIVFLETKGLQVLDLDGKPQILTQFKLWLKNPYRFYENVEVLPYDIEYDLAEDQLSIRTMNAIIDRVSSLFLWLKATGRIHENPMLYRNVLEPKSLRDKYMLSHTKRGNTVKANMLKSKLPKTIVKTLSEQDFKKLLDTANLLRDKIILLVLKEGGLRANELLGLKLEDIDFAEQGVWVRFRPDNINGSRAKAGYGRDRFIHLPVDLMLLIDRYISTDWINANADNDFLFIVVNSRCPQYNGSAMTKSTLDSLFKYYGGKAGMNVHPHQLRHTHVTDLARYYINKGETINWEYISKRIGHASINTTIQTYAHLTHYDYKKEYQKLSDYRSKKNESRSAEARADKS